MRTLTLLLLAVSSPAFAGGTAADAMTELREADVPVIEDTGITAFDSVFSKVRNIHQTLDKVQGRIFGAEDKIAASLGLPAGTPIRMSLWELKQKAGGPIEVQMQGTKPVLTIGGAGQAEAQGMLDAVNGGVADLVNIPQDLAALPAQLQELVAACQALPGQLNPQLLAEAGMNPLQLPKIAKTLANNVKATVATPKRVENLIAASKDFITGIPQGIAATEPPVAPVAVTKKEKAAKPAKAPAGGAPAAGGIAEVVDEGFSSPVGAMVTDALGQLHEAEVANAMRLLGEADASLARLSSPVPASELQHLYQTAALVQLVDGNAAAATANVAQALVADPLAKPIADLGPEYARLHKALMKSGVIRTVSVSVTGNGVGYISGRRVEAGSDVVVAAGKHLVQTEENGQWTSQLVWVTDGYEISL